MFCASLRKRPEWAVAIPALLKKEARDWKERKLETHDIAMPLPGVSTIGDGSISLRFILLSALDLKRPVTIERIERLFYLEGGHGLAALGRLQIEVMERFISIPILPLTAAEDLPATLETFYNKLVAPKAPEVRSTLAESRALLQHCSVGGPLPDLETNMLSDLNTGFSDLVVKMTTLEGQEILRDYIPEHADRVIQFWTTESN